MEKIAVHCKTQEEWNKVHDRLKSHIGLDLWTNHREQSCLEVRPAKGNYCNLNYFKKREFKIISAKEYLNEGGKDVSEFKVGDRVEVIIRHGDAKVGMLGIIINLAPETNQDGYFSILFDKQVNPSTDVVPERIGYGYYVDSLCLKLINKPQATKENNMNKNISEVFDKTKDALLVEKHLGSQIGITFIDGLILADKKTEVLAEAKRLEKEEKDNK